MYSLTELVRFDLLNKVSHEDLRAAYVQSLNWVLEDLNGPLEDQIYMTREQLKDHGRVIFAWLQLDDTLNRVD